MHRRTVARRRRLAVLIGACVVLTGLAAPSPAAAATPSFVQQAAAHVHNASSASVVLPTSVAGNDRLVVEVGVWSGSRATASGVTDSLGDTYVQVLNFTASDGTELSVWTAPVPSAAVEPAITVKPSPQQTSASRSLDYAGLSTVTDATVLDKSAQATGTRRARRHGHLRADPGDHGAG